MVVAKTSLVMQAAGNSGTTGQQSVASVAPWIFSVTASTTDLFIDKVFLGNERTLTPDISAPGVDILAAFSQVAAPSSPTIYYQEPPCLALILLQWPLMLKHFTLIGLPQPSNLLLSLPHPQWIRQKTQTANLVMDPDMSTLKKPSSLGLVYDNVEGDNIRFLCSIGYGEENIILISGTNSSCTKKLLIKPCQGTSIILHLQLELK
ncbi:hypothetical protein V6N13_132920 [Hibiscus sabdariffa]